jgi:hypothetical protein
VKGETTGIVIISAHATPVIAPKARIKHNSFFITPTVQKDPTVSLSPCIITSNSD